VIRNWRRKEHRPPVTHRPFVSERDTWVAIDSGVGAEGFLDLPHDWFSCDVSLDRQTGEYIVGYPWETYDSGGYDEERYASKDELRAVLIEGESPIPAFGEEFWRHFKWA
jgi:hypothetical protein